MGGVLGQGKGSLGGCVVRGEASGEAEIHGVEEGRRTDSFIPTEPAKPQRYSVVMALKSEDLSSGFRHGKVMAFINERMSRHAKGPEFYLENVSLSWEKVEDKLRAILEKPVPGAAWPWACALPTSRASYTGTGCSGCMTSPGCTGRQLRRWPQT